MAQISHRPLATDVWVRSQSSAQGLNTYNNNKCSGRSVKVLYVYVILPWAQISHRPLATDVWVRSQSSPYGICDDEVEFGHFFSTYSILTLSVSFHTHSFFCDICHIIVGVTASLSNTLKRSNMHIFPNSIESSVRL